MTLIRSDQRSYALSPELSFVSRRPVASGFISRLSSGSPALCCAELSELLDLVSGLLAFVPCGDTGIEGGSHAKPPMPLEILELGSGQETRP